MSDRFCEDALLDVGRCLDRFSVDALQCVSPKSYAYLADKTRLLPVRLLDEAEIGGGHTLVASARDDPRRILRFDGTQPDAFELGLAAIKHSNLKWLSIRGGPTGEPISDGDIERIANVAASVKVEHHRLWCDLRHLSADGLGRLMFGFTGVKELVLRRISGHQFTDEHLHECGRRQILELSVDTDAEPLAVSDEAVIDYFFAPEYGTPDRQLILPAFNASPQFVQKLVKRARQAPKVRKTRCEIWHLPLSSQQLDGLHVTESEEFAGCKERFENGRVLTVSFRKSFGYCIVDFL